MSSASVSVVIPTFNRQKVLPRAVMSVLHQSHRAAEVVVVDDGSTDGTAELIAARFGSVEILRQDNRGVSAARNAGIRATRGDWVAFLDSDDEWKPDKLERQLAALESEPGFKICHSDEIWVRHGRRVNQGHRHAKRG